MNKVSVLTISTARTCASTNKMIFLNMNKHNKLGFSLFFSCLPGPPGEDANVPRLSFSAALTKPQDNAGTIVFDMVFVNERKAYNQKTGMHVKDKHIV